ncbi:MAG TPA: F0F1 ATP synthase subunit A [Chthoniobacterales bacterium]|jgi:F-type H+-transporting ATPase subunit a
MLHRHLRLLPLLFCELFLFAGLTAGAPAQTAPTPVATAAPNEAGAPKEEKLSLKPTPLLTIGEFSVTNSMLVTWIVAIAVILFAQISTHNIKQIPSGAQNFCEWIVESLYDFLGSIIGSDLVKKTFWFFATIFIFILFTNWAGLIPGVGTVGWGHHDPSGIFEIDRPLFRGGNADLNMTTAMSAIFFVLWFVWALQANGVGGFLKHLFAPKGEMSGILKVLMAVIFFLVGWLEVISILFRPVSLSFRLFGNIYAGEVMLESMSKIVPVLSWLLPIPFYFMEILVGFVQALVFMLLTAVFTMLVANHDAETAH